MGFCRVHGNYWNSDNGCLHCQQAEEEAQQRLDDIVNRLGDKDFGDYVCPHCRYKSLRRQARRCPLCQADPGPEYWLQVDSEERARLRAANAATEQARLRTIQQAEDWERGAPARAAAAAKAAVAERSQGARRRATILVGWYLGYLGPLIFFSVPSYFMDAAERGKVSGFCLLFVPVLNWIACLSALMGHPHIAFGGLLACGVTALALWALLKALHSAVLAWLTYTAIIIATIMLAKMAFSP